MGTEAYDNKWLNASDINQILEDKNSRFNIKIADSPSIGDTHVDVEIQGYTDAGGDWSTRLSMVSATQKEGEEPKINLSSLIDNAKEFVDDYDSDEEALLWLGPDGHGVKGAPHNVRDLLNDYADQKQAFKSEFIKIVETANQDNSIDMDAVKQSMARPVDMDRSR